MSQACSWKSGTSSWNIHIYIHLMGQRSLLKPSTQAAAAHDGTSLWSIHTCALAIISLGLQINF